MSNVIDIKDWQDERESFGYLISGKDVGIGSKELDLEIHGSADSVNLYIDGVKHRTTRKSLSEFLWAAAYYLDSDEEWLGNEYVGLNKEV